MNDREWALRYAPAVRFDLAETIPLRAVGYAVLRESGRSPSFDRGITVPAEAECVIEYQYYWDYDIQHMYDLEHIWVTVGRSGEVLEAQASFHGAYLALWNPELPFAAAPADGHVRAFCQPGKHAFLPSGELFRLKPDWRRCCREEAGGGVLVGGPFHGTYQPTEAENALSVRHIREALTFEPTLRFEGETPASVPYLPWAELAALIPQWLRQELDRLANE